MKILTQNLCEVVEFNSKKITILLELYNEPSSRAAIIYGGFLSKAFKVYSNYTRLAYKSVGITDKTTAAGSQLDDLALVEHLITHTLRTGMAAGRNYKDIYQDCKNRLEAMRYLQCTA